MTTYAALDALIREAATAERENDTRFSSDLYWLISQGAENADDSIGENASNGVEYGNEAYYDIAIRTIGSALCESSFETQYGSDPERVRDWFAQYISF